MRYTIKTREDYTILAVKRWKPKHEVIRNNKDVAIGKKETYDIPEGLEEISPDVYKSLIQRSDLNYITWVNSEVVLERKKDKDKREKTNLERLEKRKLDKIKADVMYYAEYFELSKKGKYLIK